MTNDDVKLIATVLKNSVAKREESYDRKAADEAYKQNSLYTNFDDFYRKTLCQCIAEECKEQGLPNDMVQLLYLAFYWWNDVNEWATYVLNK